ncbi:hypothetical protein JTE90_007479 [Oedothorax gibbosus]|uniref:Uncharacterized protein n=1 Tax=Oedothorax gibbosus TaxID=931172 RepID=A0AAV6UBB2_9ARAC|nr:hypothetical protein JTE90_007479 [Oedothorax gibbosus]
MALVNLIPELSWLCALFFLVILVVLVAACACFKENDKNPESYGTAGRLSIARDSPVLHYQPRNGILSSSKQSNLNSEDGNPKRNSWTVKDRALPEIPGSTFTPVLAGASAVDVCSGVLVEPTKAKSHNKAQAPKPPGNDPSKVFPMNGTPPLPAVDAGSGVTVTITVNDKTQVINSHSSDRTPKLNLSNVDLPGTSNSMVVLRKVEKKESSTSPSKPGTSSEVNNFYDTVSDAHSDKGSQSTSMSSSPVCIKIGNSSTGSDDGNSSNLSASLAVAGAVPSSDIPYMTPPLIHNLLPPLVNEQTEIRINNGHSEVPYTVISVREPLARVREITMRRQRAAAQQREQSSEEVEDHYAMVPEEEQINSTPVSTSSVGSGLSSTGDMSPTVLRNPSNSLYSTVEKNNKQRKTIHLAEGVSIVTSAEKRKKVEDMYAKVRKKRVDLTIKTPGSDDYSVYQGIQGDNNECITPPPSPWASTTPPAPPPLAGRLQAASLNVLAPGNLQHVRRHSADPNLPEIINENRVFTGSTRGSQVLSSQDMEEPDYEKIYNEENDNSGDSCYEKIKEDKTDDVFGPSKCPSAMPGSSFVGYETVKDRNEDDDSLDPNYECVARGISDADPGYEPVRVSRNFDDSDSNSDYTIVKLDDTNEPGYEEVKNLGRSESNAADPGYEKIKNIPRAKSDATDPGYERVRNKAEDIAEPGYETVQRSDSDTDPGYEVVHQSRSFNSRYTGNRDTTESGTPRSVVHNSTSTILYVPGNSVGPMSNASSDQDESLGSSEPSATFL